MTLYEILTLLHVAASVVWIGAGLGLLVLFAAAEEWHDEPDVLKVIKGASILGPALSLPAGLAVLLTGAGLAWGTPLDAWVVLSLLGIAASFTLGAGYVAPRLEWATLVWERDNDAAQALVTGRRAMRVARLDQVIRFAILALMVTRPDWADTGALLALGLIALGVGALAFRPAPDEAHAT